MPSRTLPANSQVLLAHLAQEPTDFLNDLAAAFAKDPRVRAAHILAFSDGSQPPCPLIIIDAGRDYAAVQKSIEPIILKFIERPGATLNLADARLKPWGNYAKSGRKFYDNPSAGSLLSRLFGR